MALPKSSSSRGIFDPNLPFQGIFDQVIFDTQLQIPTDRVLLPILVHDNSEITALIHGNSEITLK